LIQKENKRKRVRGWPIFVLKNSPGNSVIGKVRVGSRRMNFGLDLLEGRVIVFFRLEAIDWLQKFGRLFQFEPERLFV